MPKITSRSIDGRIVSSTGREQRHGHGSTKRGRSSTYRSWEGMRRRCLSPDNSKWKYYGGRGITICERWGSFENFLEDMGERPVGTTLDRYPNTNGNYEPGNCRWATITEQRHNRREPKLTPELVKEIRQLASTGIKQVELARRFDVTASTIGGIVHRRIWKKV